MNRSPRPATLVLAALCALPTGCIVEKQLDPGADTHGATTTGNQPDAPMTDGFGGSTEASYEDVDSGSISATVTGAIEQDTDGPALCADWYPPDSPCEAKGSAIAVVTGDALPDLADEPCTVSSVVALDATTDAVTLSCASTYVLEISTSSPHLDLPIVGGEAVLLSAVATTEPLDAPSSFTLHTTTGRLLLAHVDGLRLPPALDLEPFTFMQSVSGCPADPVSARCDPGESVVEQRSLLHFPADDTVLFDGNSAIVATNRDTMHVIVNQATQIICWDPSCARSDAGPHSRLEVLFVAQPD